MARRKDGYLEKTVTIGGKRIHVYGHTEREIRDKINQLYDEQYKGISCEMPFRDYAAHWLEITLVDKAVNTQIAYTRAVSHLNDEIGDFPIGSIKRSEIEKALTHHIDTPSTRNRMLSICSAIYNMAVDDGLCSYNPAFNIKKLKVERADRDRLTPKEINGVKKADLPERERLFLDILYHTGIRRGEALALTRKSIGDGILMIREQIVWSSKGAPVCAKLKTYNASRDIPIPKELEARLRAFCKRTDTIYMFDGMLTRNKFAAAWMTIKFGIYEVNHPGAEMPSKHRLKVSSIPGRLTPHFFRP